MERGFGKIVELFPGCIFKANYFEELISQTPSTILGGSQFLSSPHEGRAEF